MVAYLLGVDEGEQWFRDDFFIWSGIAIIWAANIFLPRAARAAWLPKTFLAAATVITERLP